jgi:hypothetical protein
MSSTAAVTDRPPRPHPRLPLSRETERRLLRDLLNRAEAGDNDAAERLVRLCRERRHAAK